LNSLNIHHVETSATQERGILELRELIIKICPEECVNSLSIIGDLVGSGELAVLVVPIDQEAPKGRLILPQVQTIRDLLDHDAFAIVVKECELSRALAGLKQKPKLIVTDSQAFLTVARDTPIDIPMTSFSILFSRFKGDLISQLEGTLAIDKLKTGDRILIAEACSHHPNGDDIGRVKIPQWLSQYVGGKLDFEIVQGHDFPQDLSSYKLVIQCGSCMLNRKEALSRLLKCHHANVPCTNYGLTIAYSLGIIERALGPFPAALDLYKKRKGE
jgi:[FeFe] hydrogenase H-cluster maturation GTPase HydF